MPDIIQSLWVSGKLGTMQTLSIKSYVAAGHPFHLYSYDHIQNIPRGATLFDAREILPEQRILDFKHLANFSDEFRYQMLYNNGGWWVDLDTVCVKPFDFPEPYVFAQELTTSYKNLLNGGYIKAPAKAPILEAALKECKALNPKMMGWGAMGPQLLDRLVKEFDLMKFAQPVDVFNFVPWWDSPRLFTVRGGETPMPKAARAVHMWNEMWTRARYDKEDVYDEHSLYEQFKRRFL